MNHTETIRALTALPDKALNDLQLICSLALELGRKTNNDCSQVMLYGYMLSCALDEKQAEERFRKRCSELFIPEEELTTIHLHEEAPELATI